MNLSGANYDLSLDQLLAGVSDDSLHRITCNVLDISNNAMKAAVERIDALETIRDSLNESNNTLIAQRDAHLSVNEGLIKDLTHADKSIATLRDEYKKLGDILLAERDELESARLDLDRLDEERAHIAALTQARNTLNDDLRAAKATISNLRAELSGLYSECKKRDGVITDLTEARAELRTELNLTTNDLTAAKRSLRNLRDKQKEADGL
jgi:chromosome segregation ATPase